MTKASLPTVSAVIATLNRPDDLRRALGSLRSQTFRPVQALVVDQSEDDRTRNLISEIAPAYQQDGISVEYFHRTEKSSARARNFGTDKVTGDIISYLDDDVELMPDYYESISRAFAENPGWGGVSGSLIQEDILRGAKGALRRFLWRIFLLNNGDGRMTASGFGYPIYDRPVTKRIRVELFHGCNMNFRRETLGQERFDDWFTGYSYREDAELSYRLSKKTELWMVPEARLYHHESPKNRLDYERMKQMEMKNCLYVYQKHRAGRFLSAALFRYSLSGLLVIDALERVFHPSGEKDRKFKASMSVYREILKQL